MSAFHYWAIYSPEYPILHEMISKCYQFSCCFSADICSADILKNTEKRFVGKFKT